MPPTKPTPGGPADDEIARARREFERRDREIDPSFYALDRPVNLFLRQGQERVVVEELERIGLTPLRAKRVLEVGCGTGQWSREFERFGVPPSGLAGIDIDPRRVEEARSRLPGADLRVGDGITLPWPDASFDVVAQFTVFTSILDEHVRRRLAAEMVRVLRPGGAIVWCDFRTDNPRNASVRGIGPAGIRALFPGCEGRIRRTTLAPPLARRIVPRSWTAAAMLEWAGLLNTHLVAVLRKEGPR